MKYLGISNDEKFLFTTKGVYLLEESGRYVPYNTNIITDLYKIKQSDSEYRYNKGEISLTEWVSTPRKFLNTIIEYIVTSPNDKMNILIEWDKKFDKNYLITEMSNKEVTKSIINESWIEINVICEGLWDNIKSGASKSWEGLKSGVSSIAQKVIVPVLKQGVIPFLRWIRRNLNSYIGIITDIILSMFPTIVIMKAIWGLIVVLDIYEILTNNFDPQDPERQKMPFLFLITDSLSLLFTAAAGKTAGVTLKQAIKTGAKSPATKGILKKLIEKLPMLSKVLGEAEKFLVKVFGKNIGGFLGKVFSGIDTVITKMGTWISKTFGLNLGKEALIKTGKEIITKKGLAKLALGTGVGVGIAEFFKEKTIKEGDTGDKVKQIQKGIILAKQTPVNMGGVPTLKYSGKVDGIYGPETTQAIKDIQKAYKLPITGKVDPKLSFAFGVEMEPGGLEKIVGTDNMKSFGEKMIKSNSWLESKFGKLKGSME